MEQVTLGKTGICVNKNGFGALPIQRISDEEAVLLLRKACDNGITFFDTARAYTDSEHKLGLAFHDRWDDTIYVSSKTAAGTPEGFWKDLETSLAQLQRDYLDLYQFHNPAFCPKPGDGSGLYECMLEAKKQGKIRHIGITNHRLAVAEEAVESGLYETLQFPFSYLSSDKDLELVDKCEKAKEISRKHLAPRAGFIKFWPSPPKSIFTTSMANIPPTAPIHQGTLTGRFSASSRPVTTAERSPMVFFLLVIFSNTNSVSTVDAIVMATISSALIPKL